MIQTTIKPEHPLEPCFERIKVGGRSLTLLVLHLAVEQQFGDTGVSSYICQCAWKFFKVHCLARILLDINP